ncbi:protein nlp4 [Anaeramoeba ignava]|uniref:Protein nlp4 n=1 Tax=Anaeramoeba ignava TaxID=1746090 RepID=A0A9Q0LT22_ANAIG|nr:protein nlp4 [Anaeramoeba ignava]
MQKNNPFWIKFFFQNQIKRTKINTDFSFENLQKTISNTFQINPINYSLEFLDEEEDWIKISTEQEFYSAIQILNQNNIQIMKLKIQHENNSLKTNNSSKTQNIDHFLINFFNSLNSPFFLNLFNHFIQQFFPIIQFKFQHENLLEKMEKIILENSTSKSIENHLIIEIIKWFWTELSNCFDFKLNQIDSQKENFQKENILLNSLINFNPSLFNNEILQEKKTVPKINQIEKEFENKEQVIFQENQLEESKINPNDNFFLNLKENPQNDPKIFESQELLHFDQQIHSNLPKKLTKKEDDELFQIEEKEENELENLNEKISKKEKKAKINFEKKKFQFQQQINKLNQMGFHDRRLNYEVLKRNEGDIYRSIEELMSQ